MEKIADLIKEYSVRGVLSELVSGGILKIASLEELETLTKAVTYSVDGYDYTLEDVLEKTATILKAIENVCTMEKKSKF